MLRTGLRWDDADRAERSRNALVQQQLEQHRALSDDLRSLRDSLQREASLREALMREARAMEPDLLWLAPMVIPGRVDSMPILVSARFGHPPDTSQLGRIDRWLTERMNGRAHQLVVGVEVPSGLGQVRKR